MQNEYFAKLYFLQARSYIASQLYLPTASDIAHFVRSCGLILHFAHFLRSYTSTHLLRDETRGAAAPRKGAPSTRREYEVAGAL